ncbi:MAG: RHS repeat-associated core domain-containing protein, partial [Formivibrio sp.]|nr:RHS repeat-associated core domain-containing protein [Formivibrio sp.]
SDSTPGVGYAFDRLGRQIAVTNGATVCNYGYNDVNQVLTESYMGGPLHGLSVTNGYDNLWRRNDLAILNSQFSTLSSVGYAYDAASRLLTVSNGTGTATYSYLANSPLVGQIAFANNGQPVMTTAKQYDFLNRLTSIQSSAGAAPVASFNYQYNSANQRTQVTNADSSSWVYQYDSLGQVISGRKYWANGTPVAGQQFTYNFDDIGNRQASASGGDASGSNLRSANYAANNLNQYTSRDVPGYAPVLGSANANATVTVNLQRAVRQGNYFWDELAANNSGSSLYLSLTNLAVLNNGTNADIITTNVGNAFLPQTPETFGYDADGNMTNSGRWTITWDAENRAISFTSLASAPLASQKKVDCAYDFQGRRIQKVVSTNNGSAWIPVSTNRFVYDGWNLIAILNPQSPIVQSYTWGIDLSGSPQGAGGVGGLLGVTYQGNATTNCVPAFDGNGNLAALVNLANGAILASYEYGPFGEVIRSTGPMAKVNPIRFSTKYQDDETALLYYGYRYYDASAGRFLGRDPLGDDNMDESGNPFMTGENNLLSQFDFLGLATTVELQPVIGTFHFGYFGRGNSGKWSQPANVGNGWFYSGTDWAKSKVSINNIEPSLNALKSADFCNSVYWDSPWRTYNQGDMRDAGSIYVIAGSDCAGRFRITGTFKARVGGTGPGRSTKGKTGGIYGTAYLYMGYGSGSQQIMKVWASSVTKDVSQSVSFWMDFDLKKGEKKPVVVYDIVLGLPDPGSGPTSTSFGVGYFRDIAVKQIK